MQLNSEKLRSKLFKLGITQKELAQRIGVNKNTINAICRGRSCKDETGAAIADALGVTLESLIVKR